MTKYTIAWDGSTVMLPVPTTPDEYLEEAGFISENEPGATSLMQLFGAARDKQVELRLIPRPDNDYYEWAVSIAVPPNGNSIRSRHAGYLFNHYIEALGERTLHELARYSDGEIRCIARLTQEQAVVLVLPHPKVVSQASRELRAQPSTPALDTRPTLYDLLGIESYAKANTDRCLSLLATFKDAPDKIAGISLSAVQGGKDRHRSLSLSDTESGSWLGTVVADYLFCGDERNRLSLIEHIARLAITVRPRTTPLPDARDWPSDQIPNVEVRWFANRLEFMPRERERRTPYSEVTFARYNPTSQLLFVEDEPLIGVACRFAAWVGLNVKKVVLPKQRWHGGSEFHRIALDTTLNPELLESYSQPLIWKELRSQIPTNLFARNEAAWMKEVQWTKEARPKHAPTRPMPRDVAIFEAAVRARAFLFGEHVLTGDLSDCRLCEQPCAEFTVTACQGKLAYCQKCLESAIFGQFCSTLKQAALAAAFIARKEYGGSPPTKEQVAQLRLASVSSFTPADVDALVLVRFALDTRKWAWTKILHTAGLLEKEGFRTGRGVVMKALDGHLCLSMQEKTVDDFLHHHKIKHQREPLYPYDVELNPHTARRGDWLLADGTMVELWGLPNDPVYAARMVEKRSLAVRHGISLIELTLADLGRLPKIFASWVSGAPSTSASWEPPQPRPTSKKLDKGDSRGGNPTNRRLREERLERGRQALRLQREGLGRAAIAAALDVGLETVKGILRDAKFYEDPSTDSLRLEAALSAKEAQARGLTRNEFQVRRSLSKQKASEAWKDAAVIADPLAPDPVA